MCSRRNRTGDRRLKAVDAKILKYKQKMEEALHSLKLSSHSETGKPTAPLLTGGISQAENTRSPKLILPKFHENVTD